MNTIIKKYKLLVKKYQTIENELTENEIHDKRVILRRIFPILAAFKMKPAKVKNGEKAFKLFGKLRDVQVQILKIESLDQTPEILDYLSSLKESEVEIKEKVRKFSKKKELEFPTIKLKTKLDKSKIVEKTNKSLNKLVERIQSRSIDDAEDVHKIRIDFKKFRYRVEILSCIEEIDESKLEMLKMYQDKLGEIQDYEILINGIKKYCKKRKMDEDEMIELFEHDQNTLIESFDNQIELFITVCRDSISLNKESQDADDSVKHVETTETNDLLEEKHVENNFIGSTDDIARVESNIDIINEPEIKGKTGDIKDNPVGENYDSVNIAKNTETLILVSEGSTDDAPILKSDSLNFDSIKSNSKKKKSTNKNVTLDSDQKD